MGGGPSRLVLKNGKSYDNDTRKQADLSDQIGLHLANNISFNDLLNLSNLGACSSYVFATAEAVSTLFQKLQVEPKKGAKGEIYFASLRDIIPGYGAKQIDNKIAERIRERNRLCVEVGYNYIRIFQIYAALSLTVLNASPLRRTPISVPKTLRQGPTPAPMYGGGRGITQGTELYKQLAGSLLLPLLPWLTRKPEMVSNQLLLQDTEKRPQIFLTWVKPEQAADSLNLEGLYVTKERSRFFRFLAQVSDSSVVYAVTDFSNPVGSMKKRQDGRWVFEYEDPSLGEADVNPFLKELHQQIVQQLGIEAQELGPGVAATIQGPQGIQGPSGTSVLAQGRAYNIPVARAPLTQGPTMPSGSSIYEGFEAIKALYDGRLQGKAFPKAYCIGRAMSLLNPIFSNEKQSKDFYFTQICASSLDFETAGEALPKGGKTPKANLYFRSLVALYYDDFELRDDRILFKKSETGNSELKEASEQFAKLFQATRETGTFLESQQQFRASGLCAKAQGQPFAITKDSVVRELQNDIIRPMLDLQLNHSKKVNEFFKKMFAITIDKSGKIIDLKFSKLIKSGGRDAINQLGREAHDLLLDYYKRSEAFYTTGVLVLEKNPDALKIL